MAVRFALCRTGMMSEFGTIWHPEAVAQPGCYPAPARAHHRRPARRAARSNGGQTGSRKMPALIVILLLLSLTTNFGLVRDWRLTPLLGIALLALGLFLPLRASIAHKCDPFEPVCLAGREGAP
jgi:hypothetical protein